MKRILFLFFLFILSSAWSQSEYIHHFNSDLEVKANGDLAVTETITVQAAGIDFKRGLVRKLPLTRKDSLGKKIDVDYTITQVLRDGNSSNYFTKNESGYLAIYIGNSDAYLSPGKYTYTIAYTTYGQVGFFNNYDEIFWNVNGFGWGFRIDNISANIHLPEGATHSQYACYTGFYGSTQSDCTSQLDGNVLHFEAENLAPGENLSIATGFPKGFVAEPPPPPPPTFLEKFGIFIGAIILSLGLMLYYVFTWKKHGIDPPKPVVYPQFNSPESLSPASVGMLHKEKYWSDLITSSIVNLGVKGYLIIEEKKSSGILGLFKSKSFEIIKQKEATSDLPKEEKIILNQLFKDNHIAVLDGNYNADVKDTVEAYQNEMEGQLLPLINKGNNSRFIWIPLILIIGFIAFALFYSKSYPSDLIFTFILGALSNIPFLFILFIILKKFKLKLNFLLYIIGFGLLLSFGLILFDFAKDGWHEYSINNVALFGFIIFGVISFFLYKYLIKRPDEEKLRLQSLIDGFKMYIGAAEEKQIQHFNPPTLTPEIFEKMLPFAIALGAEEVWGDKFQKLIDTSAISPEPSTWYVGSPIYYGNFGHVLNSSLSNSISSTTTPPSSSNSGGGSWGGGSFGGGFSGGGGGGGGGGGW